MKCYHCQNFGHIAKHCKLGTSKKNKSVPDQRLEEKSEQKSTTNKKKEVNPVWVENDKSKEESSLIV